MKPGCKYCSNEKRLLSGEINTFNDICLFALQDQDALNVKELKNYFDTEEIAVFIDREHLRVVVGDDIGCLDHSIDIMKINHCPMCGHSLKNGLQ